MSDTTVRSLAGEEVVIFDDVDFAELALFDPKSKPFALSMQMTKPRLAVLKALWRHGSIVDSSGLAISQLADRVRTVEHLDFSTTAILSAPLMQHCVERVCKGKRTMKVSLVALPRTWLRQMEGALSDATFRGTAQLSIDDLGDRVHPPPQLIDEARASVALDGETQSFAPAASTPPQLVEHEVASAVATALMARVVEIISSNGGNVMAMKAAQLDETIRQLERRLGEQTGYVERLRRDLRAAQDEIIATKLERDGLRQRAQAAEHNLKIATGADAQRIIDAEVHRQVDRIMRQAPGSDKAAS